MRFVLEIFLYCSETDVRQRKAAVSLIAKQTSEIVQRYKKWYSKNPQDVHETCHIGILWTSKQTWTCKESDTTERLNWTELNWTHIVGLQPVGCDFPSALHCISVVLDVDSLWGSILRVNKCKNHFYFPSDECHKGSLRQPQWRGERKPSKTLWQVGDEEEVNENQNQL